MASVSRINGSLTTRKGSVWKTSWLMRNMTKVSKIMDDAEKVSRDWLFTVSSNVKSWWVSNGSSVVKIQNEQKKVVHPCLGTRPLNLFAKGCLDAKRLPGFKVTQGSLREHKSSGGIQLTLMPPNLPQDCPPDSSCPSVTAQLPWSACILLHPHTDKCLGPLRCLKCYFWLHVDS